MVELWKNICIITMMSQQDLFGIYLTWSRMKLNKSSRILDSVANGLRVNVLRITW